MAEPLQVDVAGAKAALEAAGGMPDVIPSTGGDPFNRNAQGQFASNVDPAPVVPLVEPAVTPVDPAATPEAGTVDEVPTFTHIDDNALTPELLQMKRSLQADYTRKTQEIAEFRRLQEEIGSEPDQLREAAQLFKNLQDPRNWPTMHQELSQHMQQYGMTPAQASQAASDQLANLAPDTPGAADDDFSGYEADSDLSPLVSQIQRQSQELAQLKQMIQGDQQKRAQELQYQALAEGLTRMESTIRQQNPSYTDRDVEAIYRMVGSDGNLFAAQQQYESIIGERLSQYIAGKTAAQVGQPSPVPGGGVIVTPEASEDTRKDPEAMHRAAMAYVANLEREEATT